MRTGVARKAAMAGSVAFLAALLAAVPFNLTFDGIHSGAVHAREAPEGKVARAAAAVTGMVAATEAETAMAVEALAAVLVVSAARAMVAAVQRE